MRAFGRSTSTIEGEFPTPAMKAETRKINKQISRSTKKLKREREKELREAEKRAEEITKKQKREQKERDEQNARNLDDLIERMRKIEESASGGGAAIREEEEKERQRIPPEVKRISHISVPRHSGMGMPPTMYMTSRGTVQDIRPGFTKEMEQQEDRVRYGEN